MINKKANIFFFGFIAFLCTSCVSGTFTQQGKVSAENICYKQNCYTTVYWEDGTFSSVNDNFLPDTDIVFRHCFVDENNDIKCRPAVYEEPILLFDKSFDEMLELN